MDTPAGQLIAQWHGLGAQLVVATPEAQARIQSMTGMPIGLLEKKRSSKWFGGSTVLLRDGSHVVDRFDADGAGAMKAFDQTMFAARIFTGWQRCSPGVREMAADVTSSSHRVSRR